MGEFIPTLSLYFDLDPGTDGASHMISPSNVASSIKVRSIRPDFRAASRRHWFGGNPHATHMVNALSFLFPPGEMMFVRSVMYFRDRILDPKLRKAMKAFAAQESLHSKYHDEFNAWVATTVPESETYCREIVQVVDDFYSHGKEEKALYNLALTVALEHLTSTMAGTFLRRPDIMEKMDSQVRGLIVWHAIEEIEHRTVAFDVYRSVQGTYGMRVRAMIAATIKIILTTIRYQAKMLRKDGQLLNLRSAWVATTQNFGPGGFFTMLVGSYFDFFRRDFHPEQHSDDNLVEFWSSRLNDLIPVEVKSRIETDLGSVSS